MTLPQATLASVPDASGDAIVPAATVRPLDGGTSSAEISPRPTMTAAGATRPTLRSSRPLLLPPTRAESYKPIEYIVSNVSEQAAEVAPYEKNYFGAALREALRWTVELFRGVGVRSYLGFVMVVVVGLVLLGGIALVWTVWVLARFIASRRSRPAYWVAALLTTAAAALAHALRLGATPDALVWRIVPGIVVVALVLTVATTSYWGLRQYRIDREACNERFFRTAPAPGTGLGAVPASTYGLLVVLVAVGLSFALLV